MHISNAGCRPPQQLLAASQGRNESPAVQQGSSLSKPKKKE
ncbi:hypothetical protein SLEP1_g20753 [Rubroshorea leprosula]|uniref:Uncharacterized protein n=1 Tax=Rubroshorea leprosula TaxID=152421 RepID=A0AAV5J3N7_9ROSI|nr:hypothetical protein SLEP1_g20753 [Rubroshorea leprosula]